jgi:hypothetical protein
MIKSPISLILSFNYISHSIDAHFSEDDPAQLSPCEQQAIDMVSKEFLKIGEKFLYCKVDDRTLQELSWVVKNCLKSVEEQTGVQVKLDDDGLRVNYLIK